jgi:hypothetical protein
VEHDLGLNRTKSRGALTLEKGDSTVDHLRGSDHIERSPIEII